MTGTHKLLMAALAFCLAAACNTHPREVQPTQAPPGEVWLSPQEVKDAKLTIEPLMVKAVGNYIVTSGRVTFDDLRVSHVFSPVTGRVTKILAEPGQKVKSGTPLAIIVSPDVGSAFADLGKAQADLIAAEHDFKRQRELYEAHAGSQKDYETAQDNYGKAKAEMQRAEQKARLLRAGSMDRVTQEYTLHALIDGEVVARNVNPGTEVAGQYSGGQAVELFTIGDLNSVWVLADVFEMDLAAVKAGTPATVKVITYPSKIFEGKVEYVSGSLDPASRTAKVRCSVPNLEHLLKPEMFATVSITTGESKSAALPRNAVLRMGDQEVVFVQVGTTADGRLKFERKPVAINEDEGGDYVQVTHGLQLGERVVTSGGILLSGML